MLTLLTALVLSQAPTEPPATTPPPTPLSDADTTKALPENGATPDGTLPPAPAPETPPPDAPPPAAPTPPQAPELADGFTTGLIQTGAGVGIVGGTELLAYLLQLAATYVPPLAGLSTVSAALSCANCLLMPGVAGVVETALGDSVGKQRGSALWPTVGAYCASCGTYGAEVAVYAIFLYTFFEACFAFDFERANTIATQGSVIVTFTILGLTIVRPVLTAIAPALIYPLTAEDKKPGDPGGFGMPGITSPNHPPPLKPATTGNGGGTAALAMRF